MKFWKKILKKENYNTDKIIRVLAIYILGLYFISTTFDLAVTLTVAHYAPNFFFSHEANTLFVNAVRDNSQFHNMFFNIPIILSLLLPVGFMIVYRGFMKYKNTFWATALVSSFVSFIIISAIHAAGGFSWWAASGGYV